MRFKEALIFAKLEQDARIAEAKKLIQETIDDYRKLLTTVKPSVSALEKEYEMLLQKFSEERGGPTWFPYLGSGIGNGVLVELCDGSVKYDFITGIGVHSFGHSHPQLIAAAIDAAIANTAMQGHLQQNRDTVQLTELLLRISRMDHCFLTTSGAMANENALKIAFQKKFPATRILAFEKCFAGRTLVTAQISDKPSFREGLPCTVAVDYIPFYDPQYPEESTKRALQILKGHLMRYPKQHAVMCCELVLGEAGFYPGSKEFFIQIMTLLKDSGIAIFVDEVQTFGRTLEPFAFHYFGLEDYVDIVSIGKMSQVCATIFKKEYKPQPGLLSQTFTGSTAAIHCGKFIIESLIQEGFYGAEGRIAKLHQYFVQHLESMHKRHPEYICGPYGLGGMIAFTPYDGETKKVIQYVQKLFKAGVMSFIAGNQPTRVRFLMPIGSVTFEDIDHVCQLIEQTLVEFE